tara:strand:+ start:1648 stop:2727 length:1080 start_codon:yes stop_codon:yes gene_type:complete
MKNDSIDLNDVFKEYWLKRKKVLKILLISLISGIIFALLSPVVYTSQITFVTQTSDRSGSNLSSYAQIASLAGINIGKDSQSLDSYISPLLYTKISESEEFSLSLLSNEITTLDGDVLTIKDYLINKDKKSKLSDFIKNNLLRRFQKNNVIDSTAEKKFLRNFNFISGSDYNLIKVFKQKFSVELNERQGYIKVLAYDKNAFVSTQIVKLVTKNLQSRIISLRTNKIKEQLDYSKEQYELKKVEFEALQNKLAKFKDSNKNISTATFLSELQKLESEFQLQKNILMTLASEFNNNKIKLNKDTPIFSVLDDVSVPNQRSKPERKKIVMIFLALGFIFSTISIFSENYFSKLFQRIRNNK